MYEVEQAYEEMQFRKSTLQQELTELKKNLSRMSSDEDATIQAKSQLKTEVNNKNL